MSREAFCQLTAGDVSVLMSMLEHYSENPGPFTVLLRDKLNHAGIFFREDIPADIVTLDSRVIYTIDGETRGPQVLVRSDAADLPPFALSIHSLEGLALLGLAEGESFEMALGDGRHRIITVVKVVFQPEAQERDRSARSKADILDEAPTIVSFRRRRQAPYADPDNDPGPSAA